MLVILYGWTNGNVGDAMDFHPDEQAKIKTRYLHSFILSESEIRQMSRQMSDRIFAKLNSNGGEPKSNGSTFRVTITVTLSLVSGGSLALVSPIDTYYSYYRSHAIEKP